MLALLASTGAKAQALEDIFKALSEPVQYAEQNLGNTGYSVYDDRIGASSGYGMISSDTKSLQFNAPMTTSSLVVSPFDTLPESSGFDDGSDVSLGFDVSSYEKTAPFLAAATASRVVGSRRNSLGKCAMYVRKALQSAGYKFTPRPSAYMYANGTLASAGFVKIDKNSTPRVGDVVVFNRTARNPHGHIQIFDGKDWVSDFRQARFNPYRNATDYTVWRDARYLGDASEGGLYLALNE